MCEPHTLAPIKGPQCVLTLALKPSTVRGTNILITWAESPL